MRPTSKSSSAFPRAIMTRGTARMSPTFSAWGLLTSRIASPSQLNQMGTSPGKPSVPKVDSHSTSSVRRKRSTRAEGCGTVAVSMDVHGQPIRRRIPPTSVVFVARRDDVSA